MITHQIKARGIFNQKVLDAMMIVPRHLFVSEFLKDCAYDDCALRVSHGQTISQPYIVALMTSMINPNQNTKALEIGTGTGYQTAILAEICKEVVTIERIEALHQTAKERLKEMGYDNVKCILGDGYEGYPALAPYDVILVSACPEEIPELLVQQLAKGGRMALPVGADSQSLVLVTKDSDGAVTVENYLEVRFVSMIHD
jgi:protein-L-isoaspartate(D-aspartate) O-methyltransferase